MLDEIFETIGEANKIIDKLNTQLQQMQKNINEYTQITNNVFGTNSAMVSGISAKSKRGATRRKRGKMHSRQERMEIIQAIERKEVTVAEASELYNLSKAYIYNLLSDYRSGKYDNEEAKRELEQYNEGT